MPETLDMLGKIISSDSKRDAVHIAVIPMLAVREMQPGEHTVNGVCDPFLEEPVKPGEWYWLLLWPKSITSLRHVFSHPSFPDEPELPPKHRSEADVWEAIHHLQKLAGSDVIPVEEMT